MSTNACPVGPTPGGLTGTAGEHHLGVGTGLGGGRGDESGRKDATNQSPMLWLPPGAKQVSDVTRNHDAEHSLEIGYINYGTLPALHMRCRSAPEASVNAGLSRVIQREVLGQRSSAPRTASPAALPAAPGPRRQGTTERPGCHAG